MGTRKMATSEGSTKRELEEKDPDQEHDCSVSDSHSESRRSPSTSAKRMKKQCLPYEWNLDYQQKALLVRVGTPTRIIRRKPHSSGIRDTIFNDDVFPEQATYLTVNKDGETVCKSYQASGLIDCDSTEEHFKSNVVTTAGEQFNCELEMDWTELAKQLNAANYQKMSLTTPWERLGAVGMCENKKLNELLGQLHLALATDMGNGDAKNFMQCVVSYIIYGLEPPFAQMKFQASLPTSSSNSRIHYVETSSSLLDASYDGSDHSSTPRSLVFEKLESEEPCIIVPDGVVFLAEYPIFALNFEFKSSKESLHEGIVQCLRQMLTQMHFQDVGFGIVLTPLHWCLILVDKHTTPDHLSVILHKQKLFSDSDAKSLNVNAIICVLNWIYRILAWRGKYKPVEVE